jgi:hypothetical protein
VPGVEESLIAHTNVSDDDMAVFYLAKQGYGTIAEIRDMDSPEFLDLMEYEAISNAIERYRIEEAKRQNG